VKTLIGIVSTTVLYCAFTASASAVDAGGDVEGIYVVAFVVTIAKPTMVSPHSAFLTQHVPTQRAQAHHEVRLVGVAQVRCIQPHRLALHQPPAIVRFAVLADQLDVEHILHTQCVRAVQVGCP
jgi:hypothetical protein